MAVLTEINFITVLEAESPRSGRVPVWPIFGENSRLTNRWSALSVSSHGEERVKMLCCLFPKGTNPLMTSSKLHYLSRAPSLNIIILGRVRGLGGGLQ